MKSADISVVIPCYNVFPWLRRCVESLGRDAVPSLEILLIDDGSTDETPALCDDLAREDPRIRVIHQKNGGASAARNAGMGAATGTYLYFLDADDQLEPGALEILWNLAAVHHPDCIRFGCRRISPEGSETLWLFSEHSGLYTGPRLDELRLDAVCTPGVLDYSHPRLQAAWAVLFRRQLLAERGIAFVSEREVLNEDYLFVLQAMYAAGTVYLYNAPLYRYLYRGGSLSNAPRPDMYRRKLRLWEKYREIVPRGDAEGEIRLKNFYIDCIYNCFVEVCLTAKNGREAIHRIRPLLADSRLQQYLRENRSRIRSLKTKCICLLMALRASGGMYHLYRLPAKRRRAQV